ncbi:hypothetical protein GJ698_26985 [Pseudoduganella sp. FT26W]|jgi:hypothetical protein|uniref:DUF1640 domain-containing protein n=1 Tax=Duganella aquatilis TaxID=2666082 RepID=A0A844DED8_9BURK|nr:hypothetical protein [Duganella aquatilis]MRW87722.1 hypothetical protein [Duganella aquatilis]
MTITFDNHQYATRLTEAGMAPALADIQAAMAGDVMRELIALDSRLERTDAKIDQVKIMVNARIDQVELKLEAKIADTKAEIIKWVVTVGILQSSLISALLLKLT